LLPEVGWPWRVSTKNGIDSNTLLLRKVDDLLDLKPFIELLVDPIF
jgi:hypothetical protein